MTSDIAGAAYAWIDCNDNNSLISGATSQTYTATYNGEFAVIVTEGGCSGCHGPGGSSDVAVKHGLNL